MRGVCWISTLAGPLLVGCPEALGRHFQKGEGGFVATLILVPRKLKSQNQQKVVADTSLNLSTCKFILAHGTWLMQMWYGNGPFWKIFMVHVETLYMLKSRTENGLMCTIC
ncbi:unnamed protein product [Musa acuminata subsp. malaccensis]|uniref:(wild Malaysian banana) hypothetical protein n=1 Tax=Musa acuminata subsp. malaccensis TaxID=214687 RepID=A0A804JFN8_MUSAM|nr:unnamed protein product [Musa acuminata subsp. malaccensis]